MSADLARIRALKPIRRTHNAEPTSIQHMRIDHRRSDVGMTEQLLDRADIRPTLEEVCGK